jgi:hypothetical protein
MSILAERLSAQGLSGPPATDPVAVAERILAVQGQDARGVRLAVRSRSTGLTAADVDRALTEDRTLLITWLNRGTLHLVRREDYPWLHALTTPQLETSIWTRLRQEGIEPAPAERAVKAMERALAEEGPLTRADLGARVEAAGGRAAGQGLIHLLSLLSLRGTAIRGPMVGKQHAYVLVRDWLGEPAPVDRDGALAELARRYLAGHAPADDRDLARWAGLPLRDARAGLAAVASELHERGDGLLELKRARGAVPVIPAPRLLGAFDPVLLGWTSRDWLGSRTSELVTVNGIFKAFALVGGQSAATWQLGEREGFSLQPFGRLARADRAALETDAEDVRRFLGA